MLSLGLLCDVLFPSNHTHRKRALQGGVGEKGRRGGRSAWTLLRPTPLQGRSQEDTGGSPLPFQHPLPPFIMRVWKGAFGRTPPRKQSIMVRRRSAAAARLAWPGAAGACARAGRGARDASDPIPRVAAVCRPGTSLPLAAFFFAAVSAHVAAIFPAAEFLHGRGGCVGRAPRDDRAGLLCAPRRSLSPPRTT